MPAVTPLKDGKHRQPGGVEADDRHELALVNMQADIKLRGNVGSLVNFTVVNLPCFVLAKRALRASFSTLRS